MSDRRPAERHPVLLAVDDEEDMRFLMELCFDSTGYEVRTASNGLEALEMLAADGIDLVFLDLRMPVLDGWAVLDRLREGPPLHDVPVVVVSAHASIEAQEEALRRGARSVLTKPYTRDELLELADRYAPAA